MLEESYAIIERSEVKLYTAPVKILRTAGRTRINHPERKNTLRLVREIKLRKQSENPHVPVGKFPATGNLPAARKTATSCRTHRPHEPCPRRTATSGTPRDNSHLIVRPGFYFPIRNAVWISELQNPGNPPLSRFDKLSGMKNASLIYLRLCAAALCVLLYACGQSGDLYLPADPPEKTSPENKT